MAPKAKKEAPAPPKAEAKAKALKAKKAVLKDIVAPEAAQISSEERSQENKLDLYAIIKFPLTAESAMKKTEDNSTLVFIVDVKANKHQIKQATLERGPTYFRQGDPKRRRNSSCHSGTSQSSRSACVKRRGWFIERENVGPTNPRDCLRPFKWRAEPTDLPGFRRRTRTEHRNVAEAGARALRMLI
ncbi:Hypothetical predicted protein [Marmota monax]|uniref:Uncharacterized protein n=1 Tax=Marmota monax TaxID=9995 RepID=A0A5E4AR33_MARMO|nr:hypothetical protein GHT09_004421 [Marmota monax]VTJ59867.1 Hypothetical predicted protein [Marmota monax]